MWAKDFCGECRLDAGSRARAFRLHAFPPSPPFALAFATKQKIIRRSPRVRGTARELREHTQPVPVLAGDSRCRAGGAAAEGVFVWVCVCVCVWVWVCVGGCGCTYVRTCVSVRVCASVDTFNNSFSSCVCVCVFCDPPLEEKEKEKEVSVSA